MGCGNAYLFVDGATLDPAVAARIEASGPRDTPRWLAASGDAGSGEPNLDGVILLARDDAGADRRAIVWNADGSRGEVCGNGLRAAALLLRERFGLTSGLLRSDAGSHAFAFEDDGRVAVELAPPSFDANVIGLVPSACARFGAGDGPPSIELDLASGARVRGHALSMGNPHLVLARAEPVVGELVDGPELERHAAFANRVNVNFAWRIDDGRVGQRTFERGSGETAACGSGACATAVVARHLGWCDERVVLVQPGGELEVRLADDRVTLVGPASIAPPTKLRV